MGETNRSFDELIDIDHRYFAGNQNYDTDNGNSWAAGVDCVGLINNAWQMGARIPMIPLRDSYSLPIKFKDLKPGDILMDETTHVMLFDKFDPPLNGEPSIGTTFWVYEAAGAPDWKVRYHLYTLTNAPTPNPNRPSEEQVTIDGLLYTPRRYNNIIPIDVVLVIDESGSMDETLNQTKEAAKTFIDLMRPGDKLGVVAFNDQGNQVYPNIVGQVGGLQTIYSDAEKQAAKLAIDTNIAASGGTSIGNGLNGGYWDLFNYGTSDGTSTGQADPIRVIILLSDGYGRDYNEPLISYLKNAGITVHALGVGDSVGQNLLKQIASNHHREYQWIHTTDRIQWALNSIREKIYGGNTPVKSTPSKAVAAGTIMDEGTLVDSAMGAMTISFFKSSGDVNLTLT